MLGGGHVPRTYRRGERSPGGDEESGRRGLIALNVSVGELAICVVPRLVGRANQGGSRQFVTHKSCSVRCFHLTLDRPDHPSVHAVQHVQYRPPSRRDQI